MVKLQSKIFTQNFNKIKGKIAKMFYEKIKKIIYLIRFTLESTKCRAKKLSESAQIKAKKLNKTTKRKIKFWLNRLLSKYARESSTKFSIADCKNPIFFVYLVNGNIYFIAHHENMGFGEVVIDEVIKGGFENGEFVFYPARKDSAFLKRDFEVDTLHFVKLIESSNLNAVAHDIWRVMEIFKHKIIDYEIIYHTRIENAICNIDFIDKCGIFSASVNLKWEVENTLKARIIEIAKENVIDSDANLFDVLFENGIDEVKNIRENAITQDKLLNYCNRSNLTNNIENEFSIVLNGNALNNVRFFIGYFIDSIFLRTNENGRIFADSIITINTLILQGSPNFYYMNNDLRIVFENENICIYNLQKIPFILHSLKSKWILGSDESMLESNKKIIIKDKKLIKNTKLLQHLHLNMNSKIFHKLELLYSINDDNKRFLGSGSIKIADMF